MIQSRPLDTAGRPEDDAGNVLVTFFTTTFAKAAPEQTFSVPLNVLPDGLNQLLKSVLAVADVDFDFLYQDEYISTSLSRFMRRRGVGVEGLLALEYSPALRAAEGPLRPHDDWVSAVRAPYGGGGEVLLTSSYDHGVRVWEGETCLALGSFHRECVKEVCIHSMLGPAGGGAKGETRKRDRPAAALGDFLFVSAGKDGSLASWRYREGSGGVELLGSIHAHRDGVDAVDVLPVEGRLVASASWDATVKVFNWAEQLQSGDGLPSTKAPVLTFTDHTRPVLACRFSQAHYCGAVHLHSAGLDGNLKTLDLTSAEMVRQFKGDHPINGIAVKPGGGDSDLILAACTDNRARLYDTRGKEVVKTFGGARQWLYAATWLWRREEAETAATANLFATGGEDGAVRVYDLRSTTAALLTLDNLHTDGVLDVSYAGGSTIVSGGKDNRTQSFTVSKETIA
ncbi:unnamed protein product [Phytomonas sp. Hart1]|nr:unnamed protein product [Phytomonas sp. Hart1]|eukprot:CCW71632.1 unnamed protein product [Phytomonas sp. isolate Hart1]